MLICSQIIMMANSPESLFILHSLSIRLRDLLPLPSGPLRSGVSCYSWTVMEAPTHWVCFLFSLKQLLMLCPPVLYSVVFRRLVHLGSFPACWRQANVTPTPKCRPSSSVANYRQISITLVLSVMFERLVSVRLGRFMESSDVLSTSQCAYRKVLGTCDALLCLSHILQSALESGQDARIVEIDFSAAFDGVNHQ